MRTILRLGMPVAVVGLSLSWNVGAMTQARGSAQTLPPSTQRPTLDKTAAALVHEGRAPITRDDVTRISATPEFKEVVKAWGDSLQAAGESARDVVFKLFGYLHGVPGLYVDGQFRPDLGHEMARRMRNLPSKTVSEWRSVMEQQFAASPRTIDAICQLVQVKALWKQDTFVADSEAQVFARLRSVSKEAIDFWGDEGWGKGVFARDEVAQSVLNVDALFPKERLDVALLQRVVPVAKRLIEAEKK